MTIYCTAIESPVGALSLFANERELIEIKFGNQSDFDMANAVSKDTPLLIQAKVELEEYFSGNRFDFTVNYKPTGTTFQTKVWNELTRIPYGVTATYKDIAIRIDNAKACRAVGNANNKNPLPIIIPCHRVIGSNASMTGYASGIEIKKYLLELEAKYAKVAV